MSSHRGTGGRDSLKVGMDFGGGAGAARHLRRTWIASQPMHGVVDLPREARSTLTVDLVQQVCYHDAGTSPDWADEDLASSLSSTEGCLDRRARFDC